MRYRFFLAYVPLMVCAGLLSIWLADRHNGRAAVVSYRIDKTERGEYIGEQIWEDDADEEQVHKTKEQDKYNGSELVDNGLPYAIKVNKRMNVVTVYALSDSGYYDVPVKAMVCSVGKTGNTPEGIFSLGERSAWLPLQGNVYGQYATRITGNILFHSVPYHTRNKKDLEVEEYNLLGTSVSAGCVRISVIDAKWIFDNCERKTQVEIFQSDYEGPMGKPVAAVIDKEQEGANWDPTDPDPDNPYMEQIPRIMGAYDREFDRFSDFDIRAGITAVGTGGEDITDQIRIEGSVDGDTCGTYPVTYTVTDEEGEKTSVTVNYVIKDDESPVLTVNQTIFDINAGDVGSAEHLLSLLRQNVTAYDGGEQLSSDSILVDYSELLDTDFGTCQVKYRAKDSEGNRSEVVVLDIDVDLESPAIALKDEFQREVRVSRVMDDDYLLSLVQVEDNSGKVDVELSRPLFYQVGQPYAVMYFATDEAGNVTTLSVTYQLSDGL